MIKKVNIKTRIRFNGKDYASVGEMPADVRQLYEKAFASLTEQPPDDRSSEKTLPRTQTKIIFNGQEYSNVNEMPNSVRQLYDQIMTTVDTDRNSIPDALEAGVTTNDPSPIASLSAQPATTSRRISLTASDTTLFIAGLVILLLLFIIAGLLALLLFGGPPLR